MSVERISCPTCKGAAAGCADCSGTGGVWVPPVVARRLQELEGALRDKSMILDIERRMGGAFKVGDHVRTTKDAGGLTTAEMKCFNERRWGVSGEVVEEREIRGVYIYWVRHDVAPNIPIYGWYTVSELERIEQ